MGGVKLAYLYPIRLDCPPRGQFAMAIDSLRHIQRVARIALFLAVMVVRFPKDEDLLAVYPLFVFGAFPWQLMNRR